MNKQKGSAHIIIICILTVMLICALGFIFWRNYTNHDNKVSSQDKKTSTITRKVSKLLTAEIDKTFPRGISVQYPEDWSLESIGRGPKSDGESTTQTLLLTSPSKYYEVAIRVGVNGGIGGACASESDPSTIKYLRKDKLYSFDDGLLVEQITDAYSITNGIAELVGYQYVAGIYKNSERVKRAEIGDSRCNTYLENVLELSPKQNMTLLYAQINLKKIEIKNSYGDVLTINSSEAIKAELNTPEYSQAAQILKSIAVN